MMWTKKKLSIISSLAITGIIIGLLFFSPKIFEGDIVQLSLVQNQGISCKSWTQTTEEDQNGIKITYNPNTVNFPVKTQFSVLSTRTGDELRSLDTDSFVECTPTFSTVKDFNLVGGDVRTSYYGKTESGTWVLLKIVDRNIASVPQSVLNQKQPIPVGLITGSEINSKLLSSKEVFITDIRIDVTANMQFKGKSTGDLTNIGFAAMTNIIKVKLYNPITTSSIPFSTEVRLSSITPAEFDLKEYQGRTLSVKIKGKLPEWKSTEGFPYVEIFKPDRSSMGKFPMTIKSLVSPTTNTYEFTVQGINIPKDQLGWFQVFMHSNNDVRKTQAGNPSTDVLQFRVKDTTTTSQPEPTPPEDKQIAEPEQQQSTSQDPKATAFIAYKLTFDQSSELNGIVPPEDNLNIDFTPLDIVGQPKGKDEKFETMTLIPTINAKLLPNSATITNPNTITKFMIYLDGEPLVKTPIPLNKVQIKTLNQYTASQDFYLLNQIRINIFDINQFLQNYGYQISCEGISGCKELKNGQKITVQLAVEGTFDLTTSSDRFKAGYTGLVYNYDLTYVNDFIDPDVCKGLNGEELIQCKAKLGSEICDDSSSDCVSSGGFCEGLTSLECAQKGKSTPKENNCQSSDPNIPCVPICDTDKGEILKLDDSGEPVCIDQNGNITKRTSEFTGEGLENIFCKIFGNCQNPSGSGGTVNVCEDANNCLDDIKQKAKEELESARGFFGIDPLIIIVLVVVLIVVIVLAIVLSKRAKKSK